ncbi:hypothetical protein [Streptomyces olivaceus]|uniref:hypothetical protein n=1 Tax=Streptomyces olivaceus TaxID=47716 RepID=UPI001CCF8243|nr:hypothetical protein [Streptomyces olivaceus]MBZ6232432.1 hypothetical protein [Streptomyces olivaceus]
MRTTRRFGAVLLGTVLAAAPVNAAPADGGHRTTVVRTDLGRVEGLDQGRSS